MEKQEDEINRVSVSSRCKVLMWEAVCRAVSQRRLVRPGCRELKGKQRFIKRWGPTEAGRAL